MDKSKSGPQQDIGVGEVQTGESRASHTTVKMSFMASHLSISSTGNRASSIDLRVPHLGSCLKSGIDK